METQRKILVADDDSVTRELLGRLLTHAGYEVVYAKDGAEALEMASTENPGLVLMDGLMPRMHGFLACKAIKQLVDPPKVILLTGIYTKPTYKWEAKNAHLADDLLSKPFEKGSLLASIEKLFSDLELERGIRSSVAEASTSSPLENRSRDSERGFSVSTDQQVDELVGNAR